MGLLYLNVYGKTCPTNIYFFPSFEIFLSTDSRLNILIVYLIKQFLKEKNFFRLYMERNKSLCKA